MCCKPCMIVLNDFCGSVVFLLFLSEVKKKSVIDAPHETPIMKGLHPFKTVGVPEIDEKRLLKNSFGWINFGKIAKSKNAIKTMTFFIE